ncbi:hypothetical protein BpHYR1_046678 [Brachionus plicatilis]|uniref:Uncharacterized protein n=1 Tax=Brachionus plicatilis TaxID=10195 RepID=A0A3M7RW37_BRAPC|nr:hypothetical protein BpHYR1_046678 [Brachionus plicatilis]
MISSTSLTNYDIRPSAFNGKMSSASAVNATSPTSVPTLHSLKRTSLNSSFSASKSKIRSNYGSGFFTTNANNQTDFYFRSLLQYIRSGNDDNFSEKLDFIFKQCPHFYNNMSKLNHQTNVPSPSLNTDKITNSHHKDNKDHHHQFFYHSSHLKITERNRWALIALLVLIIENHHSKNKSLIKVEKNETQFNPEILNYLLAILENLPNIKWNEDLMADNSCETMGSSKTRLLVVRMEYFSKIQCVLYFVTCKDQVCFQIIYFQIYKSNKKFAITLKGIFIFSLKNVKM